MPTTKPVNKKVQAQLDEKVLTDEDDEIAGHEPKKAERKAKPNTDKRDYENALKDLLLRLGSLEMDDLKQLTTISLKVRDPLAKGISYYDSTIPTIEKQCNELLDWYIERCEADIKSCEANIEALKGQTKPVSSQNTVLTKRTWLDRLLNKKERILPELESLNESARLEELKARLAELNVLKTESETKIDTRQMYFMEWAYNYFLLCRSQPGDDNHLKMMGMLTDGQIVNKQESGQLDPSRIFTR